MTLRIAAALAVLAGAAAFLGYLQIVGKSPFASAAAHHLRAMKDRITSPAAIQPTTYAAFAALPRGLPLEQWSRLEGRGVSLEGYVQKMLRAPDDDIHLELAQDQPRADAPGGAYVTAEIAPQQRRGSRTWRYENLVAVFRPNSGGVTAWDGGPRRVRIGGWLLFDYEADVRPRNGRPRLAQWEIHPVTKIEAWDDDAGRFVEIPR